jgi:hypothetical protein
MLMALAFVAVLVALAWATGEGGPWGPEPTTPTARH